MSVQQLDFGAVRATDPESSREAAWSAPVGTQRAKILTLLHHLEAHWGAGVTTADDLRNRFPESDRGTWSTRLSGMRRDGLLSAEGYRVTDSGSGRRRKVLAFSLTDAGRVMAARCLHPSGVTE